MNNIFLLFGIEMILFLAAFIISNQDIMAPSVMMCVMFIVSTMVAILNIDNWLIDYDMRTVFILFSGILSFIIVETIVSTIYQTRRFNNNYRSQRAYPIKDINIQPCLIIIIISFNLLVIYRYYTELRRIVGAYGGSLQNVILSYRKITTSLVTRSSATVQMTSLFLNQCLKVVTATGYIVGYILLREKIFFGRVGKKGVLYIIVVITSFAPVLLGGGRGGIIEYICAMLIASYILWNAKYEWKIIFSWKYIKIGFAVLLIGIPAFYYALLLLGRTTDKALFDYTSLYLGGSIQHINQYIQENGLTPQAAYWGEETFRGIYAVLNKFGISVPMKNVHLEFRRLNNRTMGNVYTFFRRPLHDFGPMGMCIFSGGVSFVYSWIYYGKIKNHRYSQKSDYIIILYSFFYNEIVYASIDQKAQYMLSMNNAIVVVIILLGYFGLTHIRIVWGKKRYKYTSRKGYAVYCTNDKK